MTPFRILALETSVAQALRSANDGEPVIADDPHGYPCRHCLEAARPGARLLLTTYAAVPAGAYRESGPIFLHADDCTRYRATDVVPEVLRRRLVALRGYDARQHIVAADIVDGQLLEPLLYTLFERPEIAIVHARFARTGCFACAFVRA